jgi:hypothetical protein
MIEQHYNFCPARGRLKGRTLRLSLACRQCYNRASLRIKIFKEIHTLAKLQVPGDAGWRKRFRRASGGLT